MKTNLSETEALSVQYNNTGSTTSNKRRFDFHAFRAISSAHELCIEWKWSHSTPHWCGEYSIHCLLLKAGSTNHTYITRDESLSKPSYLCQLLLSCAQKHQTTFQLSFMSHVVMGHTPTSPLYIYSFQGTKTVPIYKAKFFTVLNY